MEQENEKLEKTELLLWLKKKIVDIIHFAKICFWRLARNEIR